MLAKASIHQPARHRTPLPIALDHRCLQQRKIAAYYHADMPLICAPSSLE